ncbi:MAG: LamG-like jellyroll fold domain-containing protein, partial [Candidatus Magasanikbacteria bacterium]|nr:LamG-like jellyroll fold domain-containing protein [Candidatus Magasanikbacteria bacterium]
MKKRKWLLFSSAFLLLIAIKTLYSYDNLIIHPRLTQAAIETYNRNAESPINSEKAGWIVHGAIAEDTDPRYLNHFYNPQTGKGLYYGWQHFSAKAWAADQSSASGDYDVNSILENYRSGDKKRAFQGIGHILHLIQDMSVPAHTRDDEHKEGDPYETWCKQSGYVSDGGYGLISVDSVDMVFDELASFTNNNFFSKDTIDNLYVQCDEYVKERNVSNENIEYCVQNGFKKLTVRKTLENRQYALDYKVNFDSWKALHPLAIGYSAGTIEWFMKEFAKIDDEKKELSLLEKIGNIFVKAPKNLAYVYGDLYFPGQVLRESGIVEIKKAFDFSQLVYESGQETVVASAKKINDGAEKAVVKLDKIIDKTTDNTKNAVKGATEAIKVLGETHEYIDNVPEALADGVENLDNQKLGLMELRIDQSGLDKKEDKKVENIFIFNNSAPPDEEKVDKIDQDVIQDTDIKVSFFNLYDFETLSREYTASTSIGVELEIINLNLVEAICLSENEIVPEFSDICWQEEIAGEYNLGEENGLKKVYLFIRQGEKIIRSEATIYLDNTVMQIDFVKKPENISSSTEAIFQMRVNRDELECGYRIDESDWLVFILGEELKLEGLSDGEHRFDFQATSVAGQIASTSFVWIVDTSIPIPEKEKEVSDGLKYLWHFDEGIGDKAIDELGGAMLRGNYSWPRGVWGYSSGLRLMGEEAKAEIGLEENQDLSVAFWLKSSGGMENIALLDEAGSLKLNLALAERQAYFIVGEEYHSLDYTADDNWHHYTFVIENGIVKIYIDGNLQRELELAQSYNFTKILLGTWTNLNIDELSLWVRALSIDEIGEIYSRTLPLGTFNFTDKRINSWKTGEATSTSIFDDIAGEELFVGEAEWIKEEPNKYYLKLNSGQELEKVFISPINKESFSINYIFGHIDTRKINHSSLIFYGENGELFGFRLNDKAIDVYSNGEVSTYNFKFGYSAGFLSLVYDNEESKFRLYHNAKLIAEGVYVYQNQAITSFKLLAEEDDTDHLFSGLSI